VSNHLDMNREAASIEATTAPVHPAHSILGVSVVGGDEPLIDMHDLATWLNVSVHSIRKWCVQGPAARAPDGRTTLVPPFLRINGQIRFRPRDVRAWLETKVEVA
jgi:hypothetical protein